MNTFPDACLLAVERGELPARPRWFVRVRVWLFGRRRALVRRGRGIVLRAFDARKTRRAAP